MFKIVDIKIMKSQYNDYQGCVVIESKKAPQKFYGCHKNYLKAVFGQNFYGNMFRIKVKFYENDNGYPDIKFIGSPIRYGTKK